MTVDEIDGHMGIVLLQNVFKFVDEQRAILDGFITRDMEQEGDSGFFGYEDYFAGVGFAAGQRYITSVLGAFKMKKQQGLSIGPVFAPGVTYADLINAAANYWKHSDEWDFDDLKGQQRATRDIIVSAGVTVGVNECVASNVFHRLGLRAFAELVPVLSKWSDAVSDSVG